MAQFILNDINNSDPHYTVQYNLSGVLYTLEIDWNERSQNWSLNILTASNNERLVDSVRLVTGQNLLARYPNLLLPNGILFVLDTEGSTDPTFDSLGTRHLLIYDDLEG